MKRIISIAILIYSFCIPGLNAQDTLDTKPQNSIYGSIGCLGLYFTASLSYERELEMRKNKLNSQYFIKASGGAFAAWGANGPYGSITIQGLYGKRSSRLEIGLGISNLFDRLSYNYGISNAEYFNEPKPSLVDYMHFTPAGSIGYRSQQADGGFIFRTGISWPDGVYLSLGFGF